MSFQIKLCVKIKNSALQLLLPMKRKATKQIDYHNSLQFSGREHKINAEVMPQRSEKWAENYKTLAKFYKQISNLSFSILLLQGRWR